MLPITPRDPASIPIALPAIGAPIIEIGPKELPILRIVANKEIHIPIILRCHPV
jgi:hypothetical protein